MYMFAWVRIGWTGIHVILAALEILLHQKALPLLVVVLFKVEAHLTIRLNKNYVEYDPSK
jgi:hypothetical protein